MKTKQCGCRFGLSAVFYNPRQPERMTQLCAPPFGQGRLDDLSGFAVAVDQPAFGADVGAVVRGPLAGPEQEDVSGERVPPARSPRSAP